MTKKPTYPPPGLRAELREELAVQAAAAEVSVAAYLRELKLDADKVYNLLGGTSRAGGPPIDCRISGYEELARALGLRVTVAKIKS